MVGVTPMTALTARWHRSIAEISPQQWIEMIGKDSLPFYQWEWLNSLERSGSTVPDQGWQPLHLALWRDETPVAVADSHDMSLQRRRRRSLRRASDTTVTKGRGPRPSLLFDPSTVAVASLRLPPTRVPRSSTPSCV